MTEAELKPINDRVAASYKMDSGFNFLLAREDATTLLLEVRRLHALLDGLALHDGDTLATGDFVARRFQELKKELADCRAGRAEEAPMPQDTLQRANLDLLLQLDRLLAEADRARTLLNCLIDLARKNSPTAAPKTPPSGPPRKPHDHRRTHRPDPSLP